MSTENEIVKIAKHKLENANWDFERREILKEAVKELKQKGNSNNQIRSLFSIELKEQDNSQMIANNTRYFALLDEILNS